eukprot:TRINITY_DN784_c5_g1_i1.p1 TRINITY_DN784_c5_g1~~TRINITY_DN784_c5_g1_i1.p1  ORF type:complete len:801 (+),score=278.56 TRINITY_DN784_c5_g1_i1:240-2405(+)
MAKFFQNQLAEGTCKIPAGFRNFEDSTIKPEDIRLVLQSAFATSLLHVESRVASSMGLGFYTIGPGGEELTSVIGSILQEGDGMALHYRHLAAQVARQLKSGKPLEQVLLDRARGHTVSSLDPVSGGHHCAIGGGDRDFLVTSTLASQAPQAVGRALGSALASQLELPCLLAPGSVSLVSVGDGSVNHAQYLASLNIAEYATHRRFKCPLVFMVSDNGVAISLKGFDWLQKEFIHKLRMKLFEADGRDMFDVWTATERAVEYSRKKYKPSFLLFKNLPRRFGHAATDRQGAYLTPNEIKEVAEVNPMAYASAQAVASGAVTYSELHDMYADIWEKTKAAFDIAVNEPKVTERSLVQAATAQPLWVPEVKPPRESMIRSPPNANNDKYLPKDKVPMRKHMTEVIKESLEDTPSLVYTGEDVEHGGYYLITDGLARKFPHRVKDFPPEESVLIGLGIGYSQVGLLPIVEIPYAKYLDCGVDQFFEAAILNWLSAGKQPCGMVIRLQGFDRGVFGGNFHTHNTLHIPPGIDVVCYSNGPDYARGMRNAIQQAKAGRVVMTVDCTNLLNLKHVDEEAKDEAWLMPYTQRGDMASFDEVTCYGPRDASLAIVTYGNGVVTSLQAARIVTEKHGIPVKVIDCPYLSGLPMGLIDSLQGVDKVVFADICKFGQHPLGAHIGSLKYRNMLPDKWQVAAAQPTYNPLGTYLTFLNVPDVVDAVEMLLKTA